MILKSTCLHLCQDMQAAKEKLDWREINEMIPENKFATKHVQILKNSLQDMKVVFDAVTDAAGSPFPSDGQQETKKSLEEIAEENQ